MEELIPIAFFFSVAMVAILRPISTRVGKLLEALAEEKRLLARQPVGDENLGRVADLLDRMNARLEGLEDRLQFMERLSAGRGAPPQATPAQVGPRSMRMPG